MNVSVHDRGGKGVRSHTPIAIIMVTPAAGAAPRRHRQHGDSETDRACSEESVVGFALRGADRRWGVLEKKY